MTELQVLHAAAAPLFAAGACAQLPQFPGMHDGQPTIILPGGGIPGMGGQIDCKMLLDLISKSGMPPQPKARCSPGPSTRVMCISPHAQNIPIRSTGRRSF